MRSRLPLRLAALALSLGIGTAAGACLPPLPGEEMHVPNDLERAQIIAAAPNIVYGIVLGDAPAGRGVRFRIIHVYKGPLRPGQVIEAQAGWGLDAPMCAGMIQPAPAWRGAYGVIFFHADPEINFVGEHDLAVLFREGLIRSARARAPAPH